MDVDGSGTIGTTDNGSTDDSAGAAADERAAVGDRLSVGQGLHIHADSVGDATTVSIDRDLHGTLGLGGWENDTDATDPLNTTTEDGAAGGLGGSLTDTYSTNATADGTTYKPYPFGLDPSGSAGYGGTEHLNAWFSRTDSVSGNADPNGSSATEAVDESRGLDYQAHLGLFDLGSGRVWGGALDDVRSGAHAYH
jgi:hypothetical protein